MEYEVRFGARLWGKYESCKAQSVSGRESELESDMFSCADFFQWLLFSLMTAQDSQSL